jgi:origin recognition complex subunit 1
MVRPLARALLHRHLLTLSFSLDKTFVCLFALHPRRNLYYEFNWETFRAGVLAHLLPPSAAPTSEPEVGPSGSNGTSTGNRSGVASPWTQHDAWDVTPGETPFTPQKPRRRGWETYVRTDDLSDIAEESDGQGASPGKRKRGRPSGRSGAKRVKRDEDALPVLPRTPSKRRRGAKEESSDEGDEGDEYVQPLAHESSGDEDGGDAEAFSSSASEREDDLDEEEAERKHPRTPRRRGRPPATLATPRKRRTTTATTLAAPTPHSKAALRARASRKRTRRLDVRPLDLHDESEEGGAEGLKILDASGEEERDPWVRAMRALHVGMRPGGAGSGSAEGRGGSERSGAGGGAMLPCREQEYARVLGAVEELLEEGSGGCICTSSPISYHVYLHSYSLASLRPPSLQPNTL